jgi:cephalosporin hydroxylase
VRNSQTNNLFGKLLMWTTFAGVAFIRSTSDLEQYKELLKEARAARCVAAGRVACLAAQRLLGAGVCVC